MHHFIEEKSGGISLFIPYKRLLINENCSFRVEEITGDKGGKYRISIVQKVEMEKNVFDNRIFRCQESSFTPTKTRCSADSLMAFAEICKNEPEGKITIEEKHEELLLLFDASLIQEKVKHVTKELKRVEFKMVYVPPLAFKREIFKRVVETFLHLLKEIDPRGFKEFKPIEYTKENKIHILVAGKMNNGKSSLINLLVGAPLCALCKKYIKEVLWCVKYGCKNKYILIKKNGEKVEHDLEDGKKKLENQLYNLRERLDKEITKDHQKEVIIEINKQELRNFIFFESPGLGENRELDDLVRECYRKIDLIIFLTRGNEGDGYSNVDMNMLRKDILIPFMSLRNNKIPLSEKILVVANRADLALSKYENEENEDFDDKNRLLLHEKIRTSLHKELTGDNLLGKKFVKRNVFVLCSKKKKLKDRGPYKYYKDLFVSFRKVVLREIPSALWFNSYLHEDEIKMLNQKYEIPSLLW